MKKWAFAITVAFFAVVSVAAAAVALTDDDGGAAGVARDADDRGESGGGSAADCANPPCEDTSGGGAAAICLEGAVDCNDTVENPTGGDVCIQIYPPPPECTDPDAPVSDEPPPVDPPNPTGCDSGNAAECEKAAVALATEDIARRLGDGDGITLKGVGFVE